MNLFDLAAKISLDSKQYEEGLKTAESQGSNFGQKLKSGLGKAAKVGAASVAAMGTAVAAVGKGLYDAANETATYGNEVDKMSQKLGLSTEAYQEWDYVLGQADVDITSMSVGLKTLTNQIDEAKNGSEKAQEMFSKLGLSLEDLDSMSREEVFEQVIYGFQGMADSTERAALANDLFGKSGQELTPLFNETTENTKKLQAAAHDLGLVMSAEDVKASAAFKDSMDSMKRTFDAVKRNMTVQLLPAFTKTFNGITGLLSKNKKETEKYKKELESGIREIIESLNDIIPEAVDIAVSAVSAVVTAVASQLPSELPRIISSAISGVRELASAILKSIPDILGGIGAAIGAVITNIPNLIGLAWDIVKGLAEGIFTGIPKFFVGVGDAIGNAFRGIFSDPISDDVIEANKKLDELKAKMEGVGSDSGELKDAFKKADADETYAEYWLGVFEELSKKTNLTKQEEEKLKMAVEELNKILPETQQIVKDETGKWVANTDAIRDNIKAMKHRAYAEIYTEKAREYLDQVADLTIAMKDEQKTLYGLEDQYKSLSTQIKLASAPFNSFYYDLMKVNEENETYQATWEQGTDAMRAYAESLGYVGDSWHSWTEVLSAGDNELKTMKKDLGELESQINSQNRVIAGYEESIEGLNKTIDEFYDYAAEEMASAAALAAENGEALATGLVVGMKRKQGEVRAAAGGLTRAALDEMKKVSLIASPSKRVRKEVGEMIGKGLSLGMTDELRDVQKASDALANAAMPDPYDTGYRYSSSRVSSETMKPIYLVLDSGELVGATTRKYDEALGSENALKMRWGGATA